MRSLMAIIAIALFTSLIGIILLLPGVEQHYANPYKIISTSLIISITLLIDVWIFFSLTGKEINHQDK